MVVKIKGSKPLGLSSIPHIALDVSGTSLWAAAARVFGDWKVKFAR